MVRSTLEEWTALANGDKGTLLRVRATNHMATAATTVATTAPPTASAWLVQRPPSRDRTRMPRRFPTAWQAAATRKNTTTAVSSRRTELSSETSSPAWVAAHAPRARPTSSPRYPRSTIANPRRQPLRAARARITSRRTSIVCRWKGIAVPAAEGVRLILIGWRTKHGVLHQARPRADAHDVWTPTSTPSWHRCRWPPPGPCSGPRRPRTRAGRTCTCPTGRSGRAGGRRRPASSCAPSTGWSCSASRPPEGRRGQPSSPGLEVVAQGPLDLLGQLAHADQDRVPDRRERRRVREVHVDHLGHRHLVPEGGGEHVDPLGRVLAADDLGSEQPARTALGQHLDLHLLG